MCVWERGEKRKGNGEKESAKKSFCLGWCAHERFNLFISKEFIYVKRKRLKSLTFCFCFYLTVAWFEAHHHRTTSHHLRPTLFFKAYTPIKRRRQLYFVLPIFWGIWNYICITYFLGYIELNHVPLLSFKILIISILNLNNQFQRLIETFLALVLIIKCHKKKIDYRAKRIFFDWIQFFLSYTSVTIRHVFKGLSRENIYKPTKISFPQNVKYKKTTNLQFLYMHRNLSTIYVHIKRFQVCHNRHT